MFTRRILRRTALIAATSMLVFVGAHSATALEAPVNLGTTESYSVLGGSTVTNTGSSTLSSDLGLWPGTSVTGFPPGLVGGTQHVTDAAAQTAQSDLTTAYNDAAGRSMTGNVTGVDLGGNTYVTGVYTASSSLQLTGDVTLDAQGVNTAVFIFQAGTTLTTASSSRVLLINGAQACNVYWQVGSSATIGTGTAFKGNILALTSITATTGATFDGRALARNGAVTLDTNTFIQSPCDNTTPSPSASSSASSSASPSESVSDTSTEAAAPTLANTGNELWVVWLVALVIFAGIVTYLYGHLKRRRSRTGL